MERKNRVVFVCMIILLFELPNEFDDMKLDKLFIVQMYVIVH